MHGYDLATALADLREGRAVIVTDDVQREDEGDLVLPAELATPQRVNWLLHAARGLLLVALPEARVRELQLPFVPARQPPPNAPRMAGPVDAREGVTTGISAHDRATTARKLADPGARPDDFALPGHVLTLAAAPGGLRERRGHTEAAVELLRLAGLRPAAVMGELLTADGRTARGDELRALAERLGVGIIGVEEIASAAAQHASAPPEPRR
jgi:3,4-dihydroxy 2-butanone 4-phosphate synthase/GTP cyclohydrolase II